MVDFSRRNLLEKIGKKNLLNDIIEYVYDID